MGAYIGQGRAVDYAGSIPAPSALRCRRGAEKLTPGVLGLGVVGGLYIRAEGTWRGRRLASEVGETASLLSKVVTRRLELVGCAAVWLTGRLLVDCLFFLI